jgi:SPP1 family predicted phage head-tail adaptor
MDNTKDATGRLSKISTRIFDIRGNVQVLSGSELVKAGVSLSNEYVSIVARHDVRILHKHFLEWKGELYSIESIRPSDNNLQMIITASREV